MYIEGVNLCYGCICLSCSRFSCPYRGGRCKHCDYFTRKKLHDCDFFEYYKLAPKRLKVVRKGYLSSDLVNQKLDAIIEYLGMKKFTRQYIGTYGVFQDDGSLVYSGTRDEVDYFLAHWESGFNCKLIVKPLRINL